MSTMIPLVVPSTTTAAPMSGSPLLSVTLPVTVISCPLRFRHSVRKSVSSNKDFLVIIVDSVFLFQIRFGKQVFLRTRVELSLSVPFDGDSVSGSACRTPGNHFVLE